MIPSLSRKDLLQLAVVTVIWGVNWPVVKTGVRDFPPLAFRTLCAAGGVVLLAAMIRWQGHRFRVARRHWRELALLALTNMIVWYVLSTYGVQTLSSGRAAIIGYTMPVWAALVGWAVWRERLEPRSAFGVLAAVGAVTLLLGDELATIAGKPLGTMYMLCGAIAWAFGTHLMRRRTVPGSLLVLTFWMLVQSMVACAVLGWLIEGDRWVRAPTAIEWGAILYNVVLVFGGSQLMWFRLASILPPVASGLSVMLIPVVGLFSGMALLGESPGWQDWAALGCVLLAIASVLLPRRAPPASS